ncbi:hypothetical protein [Acinetobacter sp.]|uniref:hypothetical protein n=1 Tax=Acinetobacter sp. TaxID=472 RepID=UPI0035B330A5
MRNSVFHSPNEKRSFARKASCGAVRLTAKPVHFLHLNNLIAKTAHFKGHRFALHCKQSSALFLPLRLALRIKAVLYFAASPCASNKSSALFCRFALRFE